MTKYITTKEICEKNLSGVCEGCGGNLSAIETVDNVGRPTYWGGCESCSCFRSGIEPEYFKIARHLVMNNEMLPYSHLNRRDYKDTPEKLKYFLNSQTAGLSFTIKRIHNLLKAAT